MRILTSTETTFVAGGCSEGCLDFKNNNGYGNGGELGPAPGNSGDHNPQLLTDNSGPLGDR
jgi:hypothetical protein